MEHQIWWQLKVGNSSFWFDNQTKQQTLYFIEYEQKSCKEVEVKEFITDNQWNVQKLLDKILEEMVNHIVFNISHILTNKDNDAPW